MLVIYDKQNKVANSFSFYNEPTVYSSESQASIQEPLIFTYFEDDQELFQSSYSPSGCYVDLNSYPHWCLGNLSRCDQGIGVIAQIRLDGAVSPDKPTEVLLSSGGHSPNGNGFYISRALSDQFTIGVTYGDKSWRTTVRLISGSDLFLGFTWKESSGLLVYIDGLHVSKPQTKNSYTKPGEDILFSASLGLDNVGVIYRFEFDDGITVITTSPTVSHSWLLAGTHHVNVTARLGIVTVTGELQVVVEDVDEGQPPDVVGLAVGHDDKESLTARSSVKMFDEHKVQCSLTYGDGDVADVQSVEVGDDFNISTFGNDKFLKTLTVKLDNTAIGFQMKERSLVSVDTDRLVAGADNVVTLSSNSLALDRHVLSVRQPVQRPQIIAETTSGAWDLTAIFTIQLDKSDHVWMSIDYGNSEPTKVMYLPAIEREIQLRDSAVYSSLGDYRLRVRLENEISSSENTLDISVEVPIASLSVVTHNITSLQEDAFFTLDVNMGSFPPQKVEFIVDFDDGYTTQIFYR
ncbi:hypothetical protein EGW08_019540, partial [Elysia chlorotica]